MNYVYTEKKYENGDLVKSLYIKEGSGKSVKIDQTTKLIFSIGKTKNNLQVKLFSFLDIYNSLFACDIIFKLSTLSSRKEVFQLHYIISFILSVAASVVAYYICKWLDRDK